MVNKLICPRCKIEMNIINIHDIEIDVCSKCNGMWLDDGEIEKLIKITKEMKKHEK